MVATYLEFFTSSSFELIQILVILPKNAISLVIVHEIGSNFLSVWGKVITCICYHAFLPLMNPSRVKQRLCNGLPRNDPGFDSRWGRCKTDLHVLCKGQ